MSYKNCPPWSLQWGGQLCPVRTAHLLSELSTSVSLVGRTVVWSELSTLVSKVGRTVVFGQNCPPWSLQWGVQMCPVRTVHLGQYSGEDSCVWSELSTSFATVGRTVVSYKNCPPWSLQWGGQLCPVRTAHLYQNCPPRSV